MIIINYIDYLMIIIKSYPFIIKTSIFFIMINIIMVFMIGTNLFIVIKKKKNIENRINELKEWLLELLENGLEFTEEEIFNSFEFKFGKVKKQDLRSITYALEDIIYKNREYRKSVNFNKIIKTFDIITQIERKLDFSGKKIRFGVFKRLYILGLSISDSKILPHTFSKNAYIRQESRISYMSISKNNPFKFFENDNNELNQWNQMVLLEQFSLYENSLPDFSRWIKYSKEPTQIIFFTRMISHFKQKNSSSTLVELISSENHEIRKEAILALGRMGYTAIENKLIEIYNSQPFICQDAIIESILYLKTGRSFDFLKNAYLLNSNYNSKKLIAEVLYLYGRKGRSFFNKQLKYENGFNKLILLHVKNPLIKSDLRERFKKTN